MARPQHSTLDCGSFDLALSSVAQLLGLEADEVRTRLSVNLEELEQQALEVLPPDRLITKYGLGVESVPVADTVVWYHASRTWSDSTFADGVLPLEAMLDTIWRRLGDLASEGNTRTAWEDFRTGFHKLTSSGARQFRSRLSLREGGGPYAFLIRDAICEGAEQPSHYLEAPETVSDICNAYEEATGFQLLRKFSEATSCFVVRFKSAGEAEQEFLCAASYLYTRIHNETFDCDFGYCFSGGGKAVSAENILGVERVRQGWSDRLRS